MADLTEYDLESLRTLATTAFWISHEVDEDPKVIAKIHHGCRILRDRLGVPYLPDEIDDDTEPMTVEETVAMVAKAMRSTTPEANDG